MLITTKAIVLNSIKYSDSSLIVKCYTEELGATNYILKGILKSRKGVLKSSFFQPLTQLEIVASNRNKNTLEYIKEAKVLLHYQTLHLDMIKSAQAYFLADICRMILSEEPQNKSLFNFLQTKFQELDQEKHFSNFHLYFLLELTKFLGFYPGLPTSLEDCFYIAEGSYGYYSIGEKNTITDKLFKNFTDLIRGIEDENIPLKLTRESRNILLQKILSYYEWHLPGFKIPYSLSVLQDLFT